MSPVLSQGPAFSLFAIDPVAGTLDLANSQSAVMTGPGKTSLAKASSVQIAKDEDRSRDERRD
jgi:hypothetical protein